MSNGKSSSKQGSKSKSSKSPFSNPIVWIVAGVVLLIGAYLVYRQVSQPVATQAPPVNVEVSGGPSLKVDQETIDFGDVPVNQMVTATFQLSNVGDQPLRFTKEPYIEVKEGC